MAVVAREGTAREIEENGEPVCGLELPNLPGNPTLGLTKRGAVHLADWLYTWARPRSRLKLWGAAEIIKEARISSRTLANWRQHRTFPKPLAELAAGPVWEARAVKTWMRLDRPRRGRPARAAHHA